MCVVQHDKSYCKCTACRYRLLKQGCLDSAGNRRLVLDVGANFGYYTLLAATMGCRQERCPLIRPELVAQGLDTARCCLQSL